jgi:hypothetical protein
MTCQVKLTDIGRAASGGRMSTHEERDENGQKHIDRFLTEHGGLDHHLAFLSEGDYQRLMPGGGAVESNPATDALRSVRYLVLIPSRHPPLNVRQSIEVWEGLVGQEKAALAQGSVDAMKAQRESRATVPVVEPECPSASCRMCNGECCLLCGAGCWSDRKDCKHEVLDRHRHVEPGGSITGLKSLPGDGYALELLS